MPTKPTAKRKPRRSFQPSRTMKEVRRALADYMQSEGCSCCRDDEAHREHRAILGKLLEVPKYSDGSGFNFERFRSRRRNAKP